MPPPLQKDIGTPARKDPADSRARIQR